MVQSKSKIVIEPAESRETPPNVASGASQSSAFAADQLFHEVEDYAIIRLDSKGNIMSWNRGAEIIKGYSADEIIGKNYRIFYTNEDKAIRLSDNLLKEAAEKGRTNYEGWRVRKDGSRFWGSMTLTALHGADGGLTGYLKVTRDLTQKKIAEDNYSNFVEELKNKNEELKKSEERYHKMVSEVLDYAIILLDKDGRILDWNKGAEKLKGYTTSEIVGKNFRLFYPREEKEARLPERLLQAAVDKGSVLHEGWRLKKDGTRFWGNVAITALHNEEGDIIGFSKVTRDLTERKIAEDKFGNLMEELRQANEHLKISEERYHRMISEVQDYAILLLDRGGKIENWNAGAQMIKGYTAQEVVGHHFSIFYTPEDKAAGLPNKLLHEAAVKGKVYHEGWRVRKDGTHFWGSVVITALHDDDGDIIGFTKVTRDLTERKENEDAIKRTAAQLDLKNKTLERLNSELSSFTYIASHDLKEPLRKIQLFASRIEELKYSPDKSKDYVTKIRNSASKMQMLIDNLLSYSQISNDASHFEKVNLNEIIRSVKSDLEVSITEKGATLECDKLPVVSGVPHQLHQLFQNLVSNAIKFSKPGVTPRVMITARIIKGPDVPFERSNNRYHHITIADNGIGFEQDVADKIFEVFQRLHPSDVYSGTGIGLAIVKKIVENHNGVISAEGKPGVGAVFNLYLPSSF